MKSKFLIGIIIIFLVLPMVSSFQFDNTKSTLETKGLAGYNDVEIKNAFGLGKTLWTGTLDSNTETCSSDCSATQTIILYKEGSLVDEIRFMTLQNDESWKEQSIKSYQFYIKNKDGWEKYNLGDEVPAGTYYVKLEGEKEPFKTVDWQITSQGILIEDWALWSAAGGIISYYKFDDATGTTATDEESRDDFTVADSWTVSGKFNGAYDQSGQAYKDQAGSVLGSIHGDNEAISMSFWVKRVGADWASTDSLWANVGAGINANGECSLEMANAASKGWKLDCQDDTNVKGNDNLNGIPADGEWVFLVVTINSSHSQVYINGSQDVTKLALSNFVWDNTNPLQMFTQANNPAYQLDDAYVDEMGIWNRTLTETEIDDLYNGGVGIPYGGSTVTITLNKPPASHDTTNRTIDFNCSATKLGGGIVNLTLEINGIVNETVYNTTADMNLSLAKTINFPIGDNYNWTCYGYDYLHTLGEGTDRFFNVSYLIVNSQDFNATTYETKTETYSINVTANLSLTAANLIWDGTSYVATQSGDIWSKTLDIVEITSPVNKSFHWNFTYSGSQISSAINNVSIGNTNLSICGGEGGNTPFINFTFLDEETLTSINASTDLASWNYWLGSGSVSKSYLFTNTTENPSYAFCALPNQTFHNNLTLQYASTGYPQRVHVRSSDLTNVTTDQVLYLLSSTDGIYSSIQVVSVSGAPISGVTVQVERQFSGVWTLILTGETDDAGIFTGWVNPDYDHRFTFTKTGCTGETQTIKPTQSTYTQTLSCEGDTGDVYISQIEGIRYTRGPRSGILYPGVTNFTYTLFAEKDNIANAKFEIRNLTGSNLNSTSSVCTPSGCVLSFTYNATIGENIKGRYYVDIGEGYYLIEGDAYWRLIATNVSDTGTIKEFWLNFRDLFDEWGAEEVDLNNKLEYSRIVFIFLMLAIALALFNKSIGNYDGSYPGVFAIAITLIILMGSLAGGLTGQGFFYYSGLFGDSNVAEFMNNYILAMLSVIMTATIMMATVRRNS